MQSLYKMVPQSPSLGSMALMLNREKYLKIGFNRHLCQGERKPSWGRTLCAEFSREHRACQGCLVFLKG